MSIAGTAGTSGTLVGLNYTLALSAAGGTGNGSEQSYTIDGTIAANQAGTCAQDNTAVNGEQATSTTGNNTGSALGTACSATSTAGGRWRGFSAASRPSCSCESDEKQKEDAKRPRGATRGVRERLIRLHRRRKCHGPGDGMFPRRTAKF